MKRFSLIAASLVAAALVTSLLTAPLQAQSSGPKPPIMDPQLGKPRKESQTAAANAATTAGEAANTIGGTTSGTPAAANSIKTMADVEALPAVVEAPVDLEQPWLALESFARSTTARAVADRCQLLEVAAAVLDALPR